MEKEEGVPPLQLGPCVFSFQITVQRDSGQDVTAPKHGKVDINNAPHVGGNQWAGGTGNSGFSPACDYDGGDV